MQTCQFPGGHYRTESRNNQTSLIHCGINSDVHSITHTSYSVFSLLIVLFFKVFLVAFQIHLGFALIWGSPGLVQIAQQTILFQMQLYVWINIILIYSDASATFCIRGGSESVSFPIKAACCFPFSVITVILWNYEHYFIYILLTNIKYEVALHWRMIASYLPAQNPSRVCFLYIMAGLNVCLTADTRGCHTLILAYVRAVHTSQEFSSFITGSDMLWPQFKVFIMRYNPL